MVPTASVVASAVANHNYSKPATNQAVNTGGTGSKNSTTTKNISETRNNTNTSRTFKGYVEANVNPSKELSLVTNSPQFNNNNGKTGGAFKRYGVGEHGGVSPHVHQPQRNVAPNGNIYGTTGTKTSNGGVTSPTAKDIKQLYDYLNNGKYGGK